MKHPATFSRPILEAIAKYAYGRVLDPFAGTGLIHKLLDEGMAPAVSDTVGVELEPEWAEMHSRTRLGNALHLTSYYEPGEFDCIATSCTYGNRMADHHNARDSSKRITYRHTLGRPLSLDNSGAMQWGPHYRRFHSRAWGQACAVLDGRFILNVSDHFRRRMREQVVEWHVGWFVRRGWSIHAYEEIPTQRMGFGANREARVDHEVVVVLER